MVQDCRAARAYMSFPQWVREGAPVRLVGLASEKHNHHIGTLLTVPDDLANDDSRVGVRLHDLQAKAGLFEEPDEYAGRNNGRSPIAVKLRNLRPMRLRGLGTAATATATATEAAARTPSTPSM